jgi:hypothetical protein
MMAASRIARFPAVGTATRALAVNCVGLSRTGNRAAHRS